MVAKFLRTFGIGLLSFNSVLVAAPIKTAAYFQTYVNMIRNEIERKTFIGDFGKGDFDKIEKNAADLMRGIETLNRDASDLKKDGYALFVDSGITELKDLLSSKVLEVLYQETEGLVFYPDLIKQRYNDLLTLNFSEKSNDELAAESEKTVEKERERYRHRYYMHTIVFIAYIYPHMKRLKAYVHDDQWNSFKKLALEPVAKERVGFILTTIKDLLEKGEPCTELGKIAFCDPRVVEKKCLARCQAEDLFNQLEQEIAAVPYRGIPYSYEGTLHDILGSNECKEIQAEIDKLRVYFF